MIHAGKKRMEHSSQRDSQSRRRRYWQCEKLMLQGEAGLIYAWWRTLVHETVPSSSWAMHVETSSADPIELVSYFKVHWQQATADTKAHEQKKVCRALGARAPKEDKENCGESEAHLELASRSSHGHAATGR